jgi:NADH dehydrogenase [ubiquinone] 1 alpha subcomplex assembly factor 7
MPDTLLDLIKSHIRQQGPMSLGEYMALCLGHPKFGYYMTRDPFGAKGDFITAPEISQMFGELVGVWLADVWMQMGSPSEFILVECGPGRGTLMEDALRATAKVPGFHDAMNLYLMEMSPVLKAAQKAKLEQYGPIWIDDVTQLPSTSPVLLVANEFLDALPIRQLRFEKGAWQEVAIGLNENDTLSQGLKEADLSVVQALPQWVQDQKPEGVFECSPAINQFLKGVNIMLKKQKGVALFIDYGYIRSSAGDSVQALVSHRFENMLDDPGNADITAHVDFENIERLAHEGSVSVHGPVTQGAFLNSLGIGLRAKTLQTKADPKQADDIESALNRLTHPNEMGDLFKVIALCHDDKIKPAGF